MLGTGADLFFLDQMSARLVLGLHLAVHPVFVRLYLVLDVLLLFLVVLVKIC